MGLIVTLVLLFAFQGDVILSNPLHIVLIAVPLIIQTFLIFFIAYGWAKAWRVPHNIAAPGAMIGTSNFFLNSPWPPPSRCLACSLEQPWSLWSACW